MRFLILIASAILTGCASAPTPQPAAKLDPTREPWYREAIRQLVSMNDQAQNLIAQGKQDAAAAVITSAEPWQNRVLSVAQPTLEAMEAASDLDDLYAHMLLTNHNYGWARMMFQKNAARWRTWKPQTEETARRLKSTQDAIAECDRNIAR